jgi:hypothetical protein
VPSFELALILAGALSRWHSFSLALYFAGALSSARSISRALFLAHALYNGRLSGCSSYPRNSYAATEFTVLLTIKTSK